MVGSAHPDFAAMFAAAGADENWQLTPRTASALYTALCVLADWAFEDVEEHADEPITRQSKDDWYALGRLPRLTWRQHAQWRRQLARAADDLANDLAAGEWPTPSCTAEEMMLHRAIEDAEAYEDSEHDETLPEHQGDYDWDDCSEFFFQDHDVLMLVDSFDGIEDPDDEINRHLGVGDLRPDAWFTPFLNVPPATPTAASAADENACGAGGQTLVRSRNPGEATTPAGRGAESRAGPKVSATVARPLNRRSSVKLWPGTS